MAGFRLGDDLDDYCIKCKRLTNHSILAIVDAKPAKVRCRTCYHEQDFRDGVIPPTKRELEKAKLMQEVLNSIIPPPTVEEVEAPEPAPKPKRGRK